MIHIDIDNETDTAPATGAEPPIDGPARAFAHAIGYLAAVALVPLLVDPLQGGRAGALAALLLAVLAALRGWLGAAVRDALAPARGLRLLQRVDEAAAVMMMAAAGLAASVGGAAHAGPAEWLAPGLWAFAGIALGLRRVLRARTPARPRSPFPPDPGHLRRSSAAF